MKTILAALVAVLGILAATPVSAALLNFRYEDDFGILTWQLPQSPSPDESYNGGFDIYAFEGTAQLKLEVGETELGPNPAYPVYFDFMTFYTEGDEGGFETEFVVYLGDDFQFGGLDLYGPQLFTGSTDAPTFILGTHLLSLEPLGGCGCEFGAQALGDATLTISVAGVPEPATWALMIGGFGAAGAALRRRRAVLPA